MNNGMLCYSYVDISSKETTDNWVKMARAWQATSMKPSEEEDVAQFLSSSMKVYNSK